MIRAIGNASIAVYDGITTLGQDRFRSHEQESERIEWEMVSMFEVPNNLYFFVCGTVDQSNRTSEIYIEVIPSPWLLKTT